jgi:hypothetical protein
MNTVVDPERHISGIPGVYISRDPVLKFTNALITFLFPYGHLISNLSMYLWLYSRCGPWPLSQYLNLYKVGRTLFDGGSARRKAATFTQNNINTEYTHTDIHTSSEIRTHDPSLRAWEDGSCLRSSDHCDRQPYRYMYKTCIFLGGGNFFYLQWFQLLNVTDIQSKIGMKYFYRHR